MIILIFIPFLLFAGIIEKKIETIYKSFYPSIKIKKISLHSYRPYKKIYNIDTSTINPKKYTGVVRINNQFFIHYKIDATIKVIVSTTIIHKNDLIDYSNSELKEIKFKNFYSYPLLEYKEFASKMYIPKNKIIYEYMVQKPFLIKKYEKIQVISKSGGIELMLEAIALQNGRKGELIKVKIGKKIYKIKIIDKNLGEL